MAEHFYHSIRYCVWIYQQQRIYLTENSMLCYGPLVSELGGPECMVHPNPVIGGGPVPPRLPTAPRPMHMLNVVCISDN